VPRSAADCRSRPCRWWIAVVEPASPAATAALRPSAPLLDKTIGGLRGAVSGCFSLRRIVPAKPARACLPGRRGQRHRDLVLAGNHPMRCTTAWDAADPRPNSMAHRPCQFWVQLLPRPAGSRTHHSQLVSRRSLVRCSAMKKAPSDTENMQTLNSVGQLFIGPIPSSRSLISCCGGTSGHQPIGFAHFKISRTRYLNRF